MSPAHRVPVASRVYTPAPGEASDVELMPAGDVTDGVVRVGGTIRRPHQPQSLAVAEYLDWLDDAGFEGSPRFLGRDTQGRDVLTFVPGQCAGAPPEAWVQSEDLLASVARLVRRLHTASAGFVPQAHAFPPRPVRPNPSDAAGLICHLDVTPQNVVVRDGLAAGLVDFDLAGPATALHDSLNTAMHWVPLRDPSTRGRAGKTRIRSTGCASSPTPTAGREDERRRVPGAGIDAAALSYERMRHNAAALGGGWARMWQDGVGGQINRRRAWLEANAQPLVAALTR